MTVAVTNFVMVEAGNSTVLVVTTGISLVIVIVLVSTTVFVITTVVIDGTVFVITAPG